LGPLHGPPTVPKFEAVPVSRRNRASLRHRCRAKTSRVEPQGFPAPVIGSSLGPYRIAKYRKCPMARPAWMRGPRLCRRTGCTLRTRGTALQRLLDAFQRYRHELLRVRDALVSRSDNALSHLRLGRRRTRRRRDAISRGIQCPTHGSNEVGWEDCGDLRHLGLSLGLP
jgi:hypothetical protein